MESDAHVTSKSYAQPDRDPLNGALTADNLGDTAHTNLSQRQVRRQTVKLAGKGQLSHQNR